MTRIRPGSSLPRFTRFVVCLQYRCQEIPGVCIRICQTLTTGIVCKLLAPTRFSSNSMSHLPSDVRLLVFRARTLDRSAQAAATARVDKGARTAQPLNGLVIQNLRDPSPVRACLRHSSREVRQTATEWTHHHADISLRLNQCAAKAYGVYCTLCIPYA